MEFSIGDRMIHTRGQLIDWIKKNVTDRVLLNALDRGDVWLVGGFDPLPASFAPGWLVRLRSRTRSYFLAVAIDEVLGRLRCYRAPYVSWETYTGGSNQLYAGDKPDVCIRFRGLANAGTHVFLIGPRDAECLVDVSDREWLASFSWEAAQYGKTIYAVTQSLGLHLRMHRLIMGLDRGADAIVDHINGNGLDNRRCNLREGTHSQNNQNASKRDGASSVYKGVSWDVEREQWESYIQIDEAKQHLGFHDDEWEAAENYNAAALKHFGRFARVNTRFDRIAGSTGLCLQEDRRDCDPAAGTELGDREIPASGPRQEDIHHEEDSR